MKPVLLQVHETDSQIWTGMYFWKDLGPVEEPSSTLIEKLQKKTENKDHPASYKLSALGDAHNELNH